jgi:5'-methylthioadenosine phosphorylase
MEGEVRKVAIIGGTGLEAAAAFGKSTTVAVETVFGNRTLQVCAADFGEVVFLSRHGEDHSVPPHCIPYQRNIEALRAVGVTDVLATNAVGSVRGELAPFSMLVPHDFIDFTRGRPLSFWDGHPESPGGVVHTNFAPPYSDELRLCLLGSAEELGLQVEDGGVYLCAEGPRFESPAEIRMFRAWGADVVGMTGLPEAVFAKEAGLRYAALCLITNLGAGLDETDGSIDHARHVDVMASMRPLAVKLLMDAARRAVEGV